MNKYMAGKPTKAVWIENEYYPQSDATITVYEKHKSSVYIGLLDENGIPIYRIEQREPIGFRVRS